jgi:phage terminase large subunit
MKLFLEGTPVFEKNWDALKSSKRIIVNEGGTGSSKTYSIAQVFVLLMLKSKGAVLTIARKTMPALKATAMRDFFNILKQHNLYNPDRHNKSEGTYQYGTNLVEFISVDEPLRVRSRRRNFLWLNETNEFSLEDWRQLSMRTDGPIFFDYNPSYQFHWIYDEVIPRKDCIVIPSTFKDNPFLSKDLVREIEHYKEIDQNYWHIYGLGLRGMSEVMIFTNWDYCDELPEGDTIYGLDFGYNNPTVVLKIVLRDEGWYAEELLYKRYLTNAQLIKELEKIGVPQKKEIYCDSAEPQRIAELQNAGYWAMPADKDVSKGIDTVKSRKIFIKKNSLNIINEIKKYSWKKKGEEILDEPVKIFDHTMSALRYGIHTHHKEFGIRIIEKKEEELTYDEMRKREIAEAIKRVNTGETGQEFGEDYTKF